MGRLSGGNFVVRIICVGGWNYVNVVDGLCGGRGMVWLDASGI
jgi:hypothetical protein